MNADVVALKTREKLVAVGAECLQLVAVRHAKAVKLDLDFVDGSAFARERAGLRCFLRHTTTSADHSGHPVRHPTVPSLAHADGIVQQTRADRIGL